MPAQVYSARRRPKWEQFAQHFQLPRRLREQDGEQVLRRIDEEKRAAHAAPAVVPRTAGPRGAARGCRRTATPSQNRSLRAGWCPRAAGAEVVGGHEVHRGAAGPGARCRWGCAPCRAPASVAGTGRSRRRWRPGPRQQIQTLGLGHVDQGDARAGERVAGKGSASRWRLEAGTLKPVSRMPSGSKRAAAAPGQRAPSITSMMAPSTSVARLYSQQVPGGCSRGRGERGRQLLVAVPARAHAGVAVLVGNGAGVPGVAQACRVAQQVVHGGFAGGGRQVPVARRTPAALEGGKVTGHGVRQQQAPSPSASAPPARRWAWSWR